jgi:glucose/arabinose dehydrogenase
MLRWLRTPRVPFVPRRSIACALLTLLMFASSVSATPALQERSPANPFDPAQFTVDLELVADGLTMPVQVVDPGDGSGRLFVVEKTGTIRIIRDGAGAVDPFLDISDRVSDGSEQGLLGLVFHPKYAENGRFFIDYTDRGGDTRIVRYRVDPTSPDRADDGSAETILSVDQPYPNHNGGQLLFGPDGYLYIGLGDGGGGGDPNGNAQNLGTLLGAILRIDVDRQENGLPYAIPPDNPFVGQAGARPEIWAYGLRNPWRFSFDRATGDLWIGDVGQGDYEEVDLEPAGNPGGVNYGWPILEGSTCYATDTCDRQGLTLPIVSYSHDFGCSVVGGYVYRGDDLPALRGVYLYADYCTGLLWGLGRDATGAWIHSDPIPTDLNVSSFGDDATGELYVVELGGRVFRMTA